MRHRRRPGPKLSASSMRPAEAAATGRGERTVFHSNTETMIDLWRDLARDGDAPGRRALDPGRFPRLAPQTLLLGRAAAGEFRVRLAGAQVMKVHRLSTLVGRDGLLGWAQDDRMTLRAAFEIARRRCEPVVVTADVLWGSVGGQIEMLFAPLVGDDGGPDRLLGF